MTGNAQCVRVGGQRGLTLVEVIAVLLILPVLAIVTLRGVGSVRKSLHAEAAMLKGKLRFGQSLAMAQDTADWEIRLTPGAGGAYTLYKDGAAASLRFPGDDSSTHSLPDSVTLTAVAGGTVVDFGEWGSPGATTHTIRLSEAGANVVVTITRNTGFIP